MPVVPIADLADPRLAPYRQLKRSNAARDRREFVVEGEKLAARLIASRFPVGSVLAAERRLARVVPIVPGAVPLYVVPDAKVDLLVGFNFHQGVLAVGRRRPWPGLEELAASAGPRLTLVVCPRLDNPENLGAIVRLARVFGVDALVVGRRCPDPLSRRVLRVSMGAALDVPVLEPPDLEAAVDRLRAARGVELAAAVADPAGAEPIDRAGRPDRFALLLGCEAHGLGPEWLARCDRRVTIPMRPGADSLNVAVAAGILLYHFTRDPQSGAPG